MAPTRRRFACGTRVWGAVADALSGVLDRRIGVSLAIAPGVQVWAKVDASTGGDGQAVSVVAVHVTERWG